MENIFTLFRGGSRSKSGEKPARSDVKKFVSLLKDAEALVIGAGAGLSTSAGFEYAGVRFKKYFADFEKEYGFHDMYSGGFFRYQTAEERWAYWSRYVWVNRYADAPYPVYENLLSLVKNKDYFVLTTNVDHCFQKSGFDKQRLFYTQGDYGLFQCSIPCGKKTYENYDSVKKMVEAQGFSAENDGDLKIPDGTEIKTRIPGDLIPLCPDCKNPMEMNLRADDSFVEDCGWEKACARYDDFLRRHKNMKTLFLELGTGYNTPGIIKYPFWQMTFEKKDTFYVCVNKEEAYAPPQIAEKSLCFDCDIGAFLEAALSQISL